MRRGFGAFLGAPSKRSSRSNEAECALEAPSAVWVRAQAGRGLALVVDESADGSDGSRPASHGDIGPVGAEDLPGFVGTGDRAAVMRWV